MLSGGAGSGKSYVAADKLIGRMIEHPGHKFGVGRKVYRTVRHSAYATLKQRIYQWGASDLFDMYRGELSIKRKDGGGEFIFFGVDDPEKLKSIEGITSVWIEEATELSEDDFTQIDLRLRAPSPDGYTQITTTFNPINAQHWLRRRFFEERADNVFRLVTTHRDNAFLPPEYRETLEALREQNINLWRIYAQGEWGILEGQIYLPYIVEQEWRESFDDTFFGLDFGYQNPTTLIRSDMYDTEPWLTELLYESGLTNSDLIARMDMVPEIRLHRIYADAAEPQRIEELRRAGFNVLPAEKGPGSVQAGIGFIQGMRIHSRPENENLNAERDGYMWREDKNGNPMDEPVKFNDHAMDAKRYALYTHLYRGMGRLADVRFGGDGRTERVAGARSVAADMMKEYI